MNPLVLAVVALALLSASSGLAQDVDAGDGVAHSGMAQGSAHITTSTGISLSLDPVPGTSTARVQAMGRAVETRMAAVRTCYHAVVARRPTVTGVLRMQITLAAGTGAPAVTVTEDGVHDAELLTCSQAALAAMPTDAIERPASVIAVLTVANSAAEGTAVTAARAAEGEEVSVAHEGARGSATSPAGDVRFVVRGPEGAADELVAEAYRVVASQLPGMRDCRRHATRRGRSPAGVLHVDLTMTAGQPLGAHVRESSVAAPDARACVEQRLTRAPRVPATGPATLDLEITFAP